MSKLRGVPSIDKRTIKVVGIGGVVETVVLEEDHEYQIVLAGGEVHRFLVVCPGKALQQKTELTRLELVRILN